MTAPAKGVNKVKLKIMKTKSDYLTPELRGFLKGKGALEKFLENISMLYSEDKHCSGIGEAFIWEYSPEGHEFWMELDNRFINQRNDTH